MTYPLVIGFGFLFMNIDETALLLVLPSPRFFFNNF